MVKMEFTSHH